jgi:6-phosphogluconolactonase
VHLHRYPTRAALVESLTFEIAGLLATAVIERQSASLVVPGGSTPAPLFDALAAQGLPWPAITVTLNDERWVDPGDADSNERLVRERLLTGNATKARFVGLKTSAPTAREAVPEVQARLATIATPFDVMILGMGTDGHTASLFPGSPALAASLNGDPAEVQAVEAQGARGTAERMTMALPTLQHSRFIGLMITGQEKLEVLERAAEPGDPLELPIRAVMDCAGVDAYWAP